MKLYRLCPNLAVKILAVPSISLLLSVSDLQCAWTADEFDARMRVGCLGRESYRK